MSDADTTDKLQCPACGSTQNALNSVHALFMKEGPPPLSSRTPLHGFASLQDLQNAFADEPAIVEDALAVTATSETGDVSVSYFQGNWDAGILGAFITSHCYVNGWTVNIRPVKIVQG